MAEDEQSQEPSINMPIVLRADNSFRVNVLEDDCHYGDQIQTNIIDSNNGESAAGAAQSVHEGEQPGSTGAEQRPDQAGNEGDDNFNITKEMQQMNLETNDAILKAESDDRNTKKRFSFPTVSRASQTKITGDFILVQETQQLNQAATENKPTTSSSGSSFLERFFDFFQPSSACIPDPNLEYEKSAKLLQTVTKLQHESEFYTMLQLAECYFHLGKNEEANETIGKVRDLIMTSQILRAKDIKTLANDLAVNSAHTRAMILFPIACDMFHANASSPDDAVNKMFECIDELDYSVKALVNDSGKPRQIAASGIRHQEQMYESLSSVKNAEPGNKVLKQARVVGGIGGNYGLIGHHEKRLKLLLRGAELLQQQFKRNESMYQVYGAVLNNIGVAHKNLGNFTEAEKYYVKSVDAFTEATDYLSESEKQELMERAKNNLTRARGRLGKY